MAWSLSVSKRLKASTISCFCSSVSSLLFLLRPAPAFSSWNSDLKLTLILTFLYRWWIESLERKPLDHVIIVNRIWAEPRVTAVQDPSQGQGLAEGTVSESVKAKVLPFSRKCKVSADICLGDLGWFLVCALRLRRGWGNMAASELEIEPDLVSLVHARTLV